MKETIKAQREYQQKTNQLIEENNDLRQEVKNVKLKIEKIEKEKKKNNIIATGLPIKKNDKNQLKVEMRILIVKLTETEPKIRRAKNLSNKTCLIEMENTTDKIKAMSYRNKLRNVEEHKRFLNNDLTKKEQKFQKKIREVEREEKGKGNKTKVGYMKLTINDKI